MQDQLFIVGTKDPRDGHVIIWSEIIIDTKGKDAADILKEIGKRLVDNHDIYKAIDDMLKQKKKEQTE